MSNEVETDASKALAATKATIAMLAADEKSATGWVKTHVAWLIGLTAFVAGLVLMYLLKR